MTEAGGPTTQAGIRYQDRVAALYLGRMLDPRERPRGERPVEVRVEAPLDVDDFMVRFDDGSRRYFQVKSTLHRRGDKWALLWLSLHRQLAKAPAPDDRVVIVLGEPSTLATDLRALAERTDGADEQEWLRRLTARQQAIARSIAKAICADDTAVLRIVKQLDISVWPSRELERDYVPLWMPAASVPATQLFNTLADVAWAGSETRSRFDGAVLRDRLHVDWGISIANPPNWGLESYRAAIVDLAGIEVPGTAFRRSPGEDFPWPRCLRYDRDRRPDFDDDHPGWRDLSASAEVDLRHFPRTTLRALVTVAGPGFGKSTLVNEIARRTALAGLVPAIVHATRLSDSDLTVAQYLQHVVNTDFDVRIDWRAAAATGALVLMLDGLDEISTDRRTVVLERFKVYRAANPSVRWMMTVRDAAALAPPDGSTLIELAPLTDADIPQYVDFYRPGEPSVAESLVEQMASRSDLARLIKIPIFLALMLVMRLEGVSLRRSDLLEAYIETLFRPTLFKHAEKETVDTALLRRIAERSAFAALEMDSIGVTNPLFARCANALAPSASPDELQEALLRRGVLRRTGLTRLTFPFPIVQEYLASAVLLKQSPNELLQRLGMISRRPWAQALQFALERHHDPEQIISQILHDKDDAFYTGLRLLGRCLANGMSATPAQRDEIGSRLAMIWGKGSWRSNKHINAIIVDAFAKPLHRAIRPKLGDRWLIHEGAGEIVALNRDAELTISVLRKLVSGDVKHLLNIGELQREVDRIGTKAFQLYIERCKESAGMKEDANSISCLIGHMSTDSVESDVAHAAAADETLPPQVRLAAWSKCGRKLDDEIERLIIEGMKTEGFHPKASAAQALSSPTVDVQTVVRLLASPEVSATSAAEVLDNLISDWRDAGRDGRLRELLAVEGLGESLRDRVLLYLIDDENLEALDDLVARIGELSAELVIATVGLLGHAPQRSRVERIVAAIAGREWSADERVAITAAFVTGLTYRMRMFGFRFGTLEPIPPHPGRNAPHRLLRTWLARNDYGDVDRLRMVLDAVRLGVADAHSGLRPALDMALAAGAGKDTNDSALAGRAIEILHAHGEEFSLEELERLVMNSSYNLATSALALISAGGTQSEAAALMRLYEEVHCPGIRSVVLSQLEPLASRLGLRITREGNRLLSSSTWL